MACKIVRFRESDEAAIRWGILQQGILPLEGQYATTREFLNEGKEEALRLQKHVSDAAKARDSLSLPSVQLLSPVTNPCQVLCQGANYRSHMVDSGMDPDEKKFNMIFNKSAACISGPSDNIVRPEHVKLLDYEVELGLVIGEDIKQASVFSDEDLSQVIAGIVIGNDVSARDVQVPEMQFFKGKSYRSFCPVGPVLCVLEPNEFRYLHDLELRLSVNDEVRQKDNTANMVYKPAETLTELSQIADLNRGDLILTGTPAGCALNIPSPLIARLAALLPEAKKWQMFKKMQSKRREYLSPGDRIKASIRSADGIIDLGEQSNTVVA